MAVTTYEQMQKRLADLEAKLSSGAPISKEDKLVEEALRLIQRVPVPTAEQMKLNLDRAVEVGQLTPIQAQQILADESMWKDYAVPPELKQQQYKVLDKLTQISEAGGLDAQARARIEQVAADEAVRERGAREAIQQQAAQRGRAGGGLEFAQKMLSQQESAQRRSLAGVQTAAEAERRALEALMQRGTMASQMRGQEMSEQERVAAARQAIQQFNVANMLSQQEANIGRQTEAQKAALAEKARVQELNLAAQQAEAANRAALPEAQFTMQMQKAQPMADIKVGQASAWQAQQEAQAAREQAAREASKDRKNKLIGGLVSAGGSVLGGVFSDERVKEDIKPVSDIDVNDFLEKITGHKYRYRGDDRSVGGVMAQDVEKSEMGEGMVEDTPGGKMIDAGKMVGALAASLANINDRLNELEGKKRG